MGDFFTRNGVQLIAEGLGFKNKYSSSLGHLGVKRSISARIKLARKNCHLVPSPASHHGLTKSIILSDFRAAFYSFSFHNNFYIESHSIWRAERFGLMRKISDKRDTRNVCQVTVTESIVVFLQLRRSIYIFTDLLFFLLCLFAFISFCVHCAISQYFTWGSLTQMASCNQEFHSWLMADGFAFSFGQQKSVGRSLTFKVSAYSQGRLIGEEIRYF